MQDIRMLFNANVQLREWHITKHTITLLLYTSIAFFDTQVISSACENPGGWPSVYRTFRWCLALISARHQRNIPLNSTFVLCDDFNFLKITWSCSYNLLTNGNSCRGIFLNNLLKTRFISMYYWACTIL